MGVPLPGYAAPMRHNDPSSMKRRMHPLKADICSDAVIIIVFCFLLLLLLFMGVYYVWSVFARQYFVFFSSFAIMPL